MTESETDMRKILLIAVVVSFLMVSCKGQVSTTRFPMPHVGTWSGLDSTNTKGVVTFRENGTGAMEYGGSTYEFQYFFDYGKNPVWLDLVYSRDGKPFRARLIVKYQDETHLKWYTFFTEVRPESFPETEAGKVMTLTRLGPPMKV